MSRWCYLATVHPAMPASWADRGLSSRPFTPRSIKGSGWDAHSKQLQNSITLPDSVGLHVGEKLKEQIAKVYSEKK